MLKNKIFIICILIIALNNSCDSNSEKEQKPLVYEGMSASELKNNLGSPISIDSSGEVYSPELKQKISVQKWKYDKRMVLIINDTVKDSNMN